MRVRGWVVLLVLVFLGPPLNGDVVEEPKDCGEEGWEEDLLSWRQDRNEGLADPEGWLSVVGLFWLQEGRQSFGSGSDQDLRLPEGLAAENVGWLDKEGDHIWVESAPGVGVTTSAGHKVRRLPLPSDASGKATVLVHNHLRMYLIQRGGRYALRVKDVKHAAIEEFQGTEHFPPDPDWCLNARFEAATEPRGIKIPTVLGTLEEQSSPGSVIFQWQDREYRLEALEGGQGGLFLVFGDSTNGTDTYGGGRFLSTPAPTADGRVQLDFNRAYSPPCLFTAFATCPLPPRENKLDVAIPAGEKATGFDH